jgi:glycosyltransferase involved in cell wall biosynthesis
MADPLDQVTPLVLTYNEEANIGRTLAGLHWARRIVVVDSGSTDRTLEILAASSRVEVLNRGFDSFAEQCSFGLLHIQTPWCLSLDADHVITPAFVREMAALIRRSGSDLSAIVTPFRYCVFGKPLRGTLLPPRCNLLRLGGGYYENDGHAHRFVPNGPTVLMKTAILHDDRKPLSRWLNSQQRYLLQEAEKFLATPERELTLSDRLRRQKLLAPFLILLLCLIWHRGLLDGWRGWFYAFQRAYVEILFSLMLMEADHADHLNTSKAYLVSAGV